MCTRTRKRIHASLLASLLTLTTGVGTAEAANWNITVTRNNSTTASVVWDVSLNVQYTFCWKLESVSGDVCGNNGNQLSITPTLNSSGYFTNATGGHMVQMLLGLTCNQDYKVRIKRSALVFDTKIFQIAC